VFRAVAKIGSLRLCSAEVITSLSSTVFVNNMPICVMGSVDSHGGMAITGSDSVFANNIPICRMGDINDVCRWVYKPHFCQPIVKCSVTIVDDVFTV